MKHQNVRMAKNIEECNAITHDGIFHPDDVFACAILSLLYPEIVLMRTRDRSIIKLKRTDAIIFDVGLVYDPISSSFDHHQEGFDKRRPGGGLKYASAGLIWLEFGDKILEKMLRERFGYCPGPGYIEAIKARVDKSLLANIDAHDTGEKLNFYTSNVAGYISKKNLIWETDDPKAKNNGAFIEAVHYAKKILETEIISAISVEHGKAVIKKYVEAIEDEETEILVLPRFVGGWASQITSMNTGVAKRLKIVVMPSFPEGDLWFARAIPDSRCDDDELNGFGGKCRMLFPESWRTLSEKGFKLETGVIDATFCNKDGSFAAARTQEGAIQLAKLALEIKNQEISIEEFAMQSEHAVQLGIAGSSF